MESQNGWDPVSGIGTVSSKINSCKSLVPRDGRRASAEIYVRLYIIKPIIRARPGLLIKMQNGIWICFH